MTSNAIVWKQKKKYEKGKSIRKNVKCKQFETEPKIILQNCVTQQANTKKCKQKKTE